MITNKRNERPVFLVKRTENIKLLDPTVKFKEGELLLEKDSGYLYVSLADNSTAKDLKVVTMPNEFITPEDNKEEIETLRKTIDQLRKDVQNIKKKLKASEEDVNPEPEIKKTSKTTTKKKTTNKD